MANRYWRGTAGTGWSTTANWSDTSGGSTGFSVPTGADNVFFDGNGNNPCTLNNTTTGGATITWDSTYTSTFNFNNQLLTAGDVTLGANTTYQNSGTGIQMTGTLTSNGKVLTKITFSATGTISDTLTVTNLATTNATTTITLNANVNVTNLTLANQNNNVTINGNYNINISGQFQTNFGTGQLQGTTTIVLNGSANVIRSALTSTAIKIGSNLVFRND